MSYRFKFRYGLSRSEIERFVEANQCVRAFLGKFRDKGSYQNYARAIAMFFKWLRVVQGLSLSPEQFLDTLDQKRRGNRLERSWAKNLLLAFSRDNPDLAERSERYKYLSFFMPVKVFCDYHELPVTSARGVFGKVRKRKNQEPVYTIELARRAVSALNQRDRAVCMVALQSGQSIGQVLGDVNDMKDYVWRQIDMGRERIRLDFPERKGNGFHYFSFIGHDAVQELRKWRVKRERLVKALGHDPEWLFITKTGSKYTEHKFLTCFRERLTRHKVYTGHLSVRSHMFRKIFEQEASPPERGISKAYVAFMMGHITGLDSVGGVYDKQPFVNPRVVESEYAKLEPYLNIYSSHMGTSSLSKEYLQMFESLAKVLDRYPDRAEKFEKFLMEL